MSAVGRLCGVVNGADVRTGVGDGRALRSEARRALLLCRCVGRRGRRRRGHETMRGVLRMGIFQSSREPVVRRLSVGRCNVVRCNVVRRSSVVVVVVADSRVRSDKGQ